MKITIDEKKCLKHKVTLTECLLALAVRSCQNVGEILANMLSREILVEKDGKYLITQHWSDVLDEILCNSNGAQDDNRITELATKMREAYPKGSMINKATGKPTTFYFRCNLGEIKHKLKTFFFRYGNYTDEEILNAEKRYVAKWNNDFQQPGFRQLKYFIFKDEKKEGIDGNYVETISPLLDLLENEESDEEVHTNEDWTIKSRN